ncbi:MAG: ATP synthase subunit I [Lachnospiraceae bacterium]|nr:ATP synthase subunit I [Lachnospiraceae bacterium]
MKKIVLGINRTLFELEVGILIFGGLCQLFVFLPKDKLSYSLGLWVGIITAAFAAFHMWWTLDKGLDLEEKSAVGYLGRQNVIRYVVIVAVIVTVAVSGVVNPLSAFLGVMGLKVSAYMQPLTKKISRRIYGEEILPDLIEEPDAVQE